MGGRLTGADSTGFLPSIRCVARVPPSVLELEGGCETGAERTSRF